MPPKVSAPVFVAERSKTPLTVPASVSAPIFLISVFALRVMLPAAVAAELLEFASAPELLTPEPARLSALAMLKPLRSSDAPADTVTPAVDAPRAAEAPTRTVPALIVVPPE